MTDTVITGTSTCRKEKLFLLALIVVYGYMNWGHLFQDFWNDEIYTIKNFILVPINVTLTDYHVPNNHVLFSLVLNLYTTAIDIRSIKEIFLEPYTLRVVPFLLSLCTIVFTYKVARIIGGKYSGPLSISILIFSLSFYEFSLQIRGYSLSLLLCSATLYYYYRYLYFGSTNLLTLMAIVVGLLAYTIPSNYYFILGLFLTSLIRLVMHYLVQENNHGVTDQLSRKFVHLMAALVIGVLISFVLYAPVIFEVFNNNEVRAYGREYGKSVQLFYMVTSAFISRNVLIIVASLLGLFAIVLYPASRRKYSEVWVLLVVFVSPFIISAIRGDNPPPRAFVNLIPVFSVIIGLLLTALLHRTEYRAILVCAFIVYGGLSFYYERHRLSGIIYSNIFQGRRAQELNYSYYSHHYFPLKSIRTYLSNRKKDIPLYVLDSEPHGLPEYLKVMEIDFQNYFHPEEKELNLKESGQIYVVTSRPNKFLNMVVESGADVSLRRISDRGSYHNFFYVEAL